jgi:hypothetical protein
MDKVELQYYFLVGKDYFMKQTMYSKNKTAKVKKLLKENKVNVISLEDFRRIKIGSKVRVRRAPYHYLKNNTVVEVINHMRKTLHGDIEVKGEVISGAILPQMIGIKDIKEVLK